MRRPDLSGVRGRPAPIPTSLSSAAPSVRERSVEVDRGVRAIAERLVRRASATTDRHGVGGLDHAPVGGGQYRRAGDDVGTVLTGCDGDVGHGVDLPQAILMVLENGS